MWFMTIAVHCVAKMGEIRRLFITVKTVHIATVTHAFNCTTNFIEDTRCSTEATSTNGPRPQYLQARSSGVRNIRAK